MLKPSKKIKPYSPDFNELIQRMCDEINKLSTMSQDIDRALRVINTMGEGSEGDEIVFATIATNPTQGYPGCSTPCPDCDNCGGQVGGGITYSVVWEKFNASQMGTYDNSDAEGEQVEIDPVEQGFGVGLDLHWDVNCPCQQPDGIEIYPQTLAIGTKVMGQLLRNGAPAPNNQIQDLVLFSSVMPRLGVRCEE